jgi:hypothetical protein
VLDPTLVQFIGNLRWRRLCRPCTQNLVFILLEQPERPAPGMISLYSVFNEVSKYAHVLDAVELYTTGGRQPPSDTDCRVLAFGQLRDVIVATDDLGMHQLAKDFELPIWHGWELLAKMRSAKKVDNDLIREIYDALECNGDLTATWREAKHTEFAKVIGPKR